MRAPCSHHASPVRLRACNARATYVQRPFNAWCWSRTTCAAAGKRVVAGSLKPSGFPVGFPWVSQWVFPEVLRVAHPRQCNTQQTPVVGATGHATAAQQPDLKALAAAVIGSLNAQQAAQHGSTNPEKPAQQTPVAEGASVARLRGRLHRLAADAGRKLSSRLAVASLDDAAWPGIRCASLSFIGRSGLSIRFHPIPSDSKGAQAPPIWWHI